MMDFKNPYAGRAGNAASAPRLGAGMPMGGGRIVKPNRIKTMALLYANPISGNNMGLGQSWTISDVSLAASVKGYNWQVYRNRCYDMGAPYKSFYDTTSGGQSAFGINASASLGFGDTVAMFAGLNFDRIAWGYTPPENWLQRVDYWAAKAGRPRPEQGFYFFNILNVNQAIPLDGLGNEMRQIQIDTGGVFESATTSSHGCLTVDIYEDETGGYPHHCTNNQVRGTSTVHTWEIDYSNTSTFGSMCTQMATTLRDRVATYWPTRPPDFVITDNALATPNSVITAAISNGQELAAIAGATFRSTWTLWPTAFKLYNPNIEFWANHGLPDETYYAANKIVGRYGEFAFTNDTGPGSTSASLATLQGRILNAKTLGTKWAVDHSYAGVGNVDLWHSSTGPGSGNTWSALKDYSVSIGAQDNFFAVACRTSGGFYTHYQPEFNLD